MEQFVSSKTPKVVIPFPLPEELCEEVGETFTLDGDVERTSGLLLRYVETNLYLHHAHTCTFSLQV